MTTQIQLWHILTSSPEHTSSLGHMQIWLHFAISRRSLCWERSTESRNTWYSSTSCLSSTSQVQYNTIQYNTIQYNSSTHLLTSVLIYWHQYSFIDTSTHLLTSVLIYWHQYSFIDFSTDGLKTKRVTISGSVLSLRVCSDETKRVLTNQVCVQESATRVLCGLWRSSRSTPRTTRPRYIDLVKTVIVHLLILNSFFCKNISWIHSFVKISLEFILLWTSLNSFFVNIIEFILLWTSLNSFFCKHHWILSCCWRRRRRTRRVSTRESCSREARRERE